ncbi:hypothetical protein GNX18_14920 [Microbulbifer sp. SH-1]|uniref:hypothetical protein n=1 Tax=Microbulbifer sp. SH-1 TaxID=2681547 RepID=UPI0014097064|nr:hypothetical protein [Microbulbifer sp. SH-1]QIL90920.1 hypothetical protein GNX18_14920 [Microbulbifer sp. SH-1]
MLKLSPLITLLLFALSFAATAQEEGEVISLESTIVGSQEQPKVLYIIPWKQAASLEKIESTIHTAIDHSFQHQEYSELKREIKLVQESENNN